MLVSDWMEGGGVCVLWIPILTILLMSCNVMPCHVSMLHIDGIVEISLPLIVLYILLDLECLHSKSNTYVKSGYAVCCVW